MIEPTDRTADGRAAGVWGDMRDRAAAGRPVRVEEYLADPSLPTDDEFVLDLVYGEFVVRQQSGDVPDADEYARRFPRLADRIRRQLDLHTAVLGATAGPTDDAAGTRTWAKTVTPSTPSTPSAATTDRLPETIGQFRVISRLGAGGQATVYRAVHTALGRDVVVKVAHAPSAGGPTGDEPLDGEARILAGLDHPNLARVYDLGRDDGRPFVVMEYVPGRSLDQATRAARPAPREAARLTAAVARAVAYAHSRGVTHLDIKPANVLLGEDGIPRLIDFGLGRHRSPWQDDRDDSGGTSGTLAYLPPERAAGRPDQSLERVDVFGLGGVLYFLLAGRPPYHGRTAAEVWEKARAGAWDAAPLDQVGVPARLRAICRRCLAADPAERYASADAVAADLERYARVPLVTRRALIGAGGVVAVLAAAGLASVYWPRRPEPDLIPATPTPPAPPNPPPDPSLRVRVWNGERHQDLALALPLRTGDEVRIEGDRPPGTHAVIVWAGTDGVVHELSSALPEAAGTAIHYPATGSVEVRGPVGTELILLCCRRDRPVDVAALRAALADVPRWPALPGGSLVWLSGDAVKVENVGRGPGAPVERVDPEAVVSDRLTRLRTTLTADGVSVAGVAVAHR